MKTYVVGFDLDSPGQDYRGISARIKELGAWWHNLDSTWLVRTELTAVQLRDDLSQLLDANDKLLVIDVTHQPAAWTGFSQAASAWIKQWM